MQFFLSHGIYNLLDNKGGFYMFLKDCKKGDIIEILEIKDDWAREQVIRFGIVQGIKLNCQSIIKNGPVIVSRGNQHIAIGYQVAQRIVVSKGDLKWGRR